MILTLSVVSKDGMYLTYSFKTDDWAWTNNIQKAWFKPPGFWVKHREKVQPFINGARLLKFTCEQQPEGQ